MSVSRLKPWREFEKLAETIYRELSPMADVRWNDYILGGDSEVERQIDVSIRWVLDGRDHLVVVQVKNWNHRADIKAVGEFASVVKDVRASGGILVCKSGFSKNALRYARNIGIGLHNLHDAQSMEWATVLAIPIVWVDLSPYINFTALFNGDSGDVVRYEDLPGVLIGGDGKSIKLTEYFSRQWNAGTLDRALATTHRVEFDEVWIPAKTSTGKDVLRPATKVNFTYFVRRKAWLGQFSPTEWRGVRDYLAESIVVSHLPIGQIPSRRDENWVEISDPSKVALDIEGSFVTTEAFEVDVNGIEDPKITLQFVE